LKACISASRTIPIAEAAFRSVIGANPADLPIEFPIKFELAVNRTTAKALNIELPTSILLRANDVIE
jgi:ABC-type uncharacterized transport system substrate-binding protein